MVDALKANKKLCWLMGVAIAIATVRWSIAKAIHTACFLSVIWVTDKKRIIKTVVNEVFYADGIVSLLWCSTVASCQ